MDRTLSNVGIFYRNKFTYSKHLKQLPNSLMHFALDNLNSLCVSLPLRTRSHHSCNAILGKVKIRESQSQIWNAFETENWQKLNHFPPTVRFENVQKYPFFVIISCVRLFCMQIFLTQLLSSLAQPLKMWNSFAVMYSVHLHSNHSQC